MKNHIVKHITFILIILICKQITAQQFFIKNYTLENGLPTRMINDACQDSLGNMWFATFYGISKFDGFSFTNYDSKDGLPVKSYRKLRLDKKGILWAIPYGTGSYILYFKDNQWHTYVSLSDLTQNIEFSCFDIIYSKNDIIICIGSNKGLYINKNKKWEKINFSENPELNVVNSLYAFEDKFYISFCQILQ